MTRITIPVNEGVIRWALERSSHEAMDLTRRFPHITDWLTGNRQPTMHQLEELAKATSTPLGFFFLSEPPTLRLTIPHFRTVRDGNPRNPSADLLETVQNMERRQDWMRDYLIELGEEPLGFIGSAKIMEEPERYAAEIRQTLELSDEWAAKQPNWTEALRYLIHKMENIGILVVVNSIVGNNTHRGLDPVEFRGFVLVDQYAPLVFINGADGKAAQMFTLAHELAHLWFGYSAAFDLAELQPADNEKEQACNRLAAEFLVPADKLCAFWPSLDRQLDPFQQMARRFKVSELVAARRAIDLKLITRSEFFDFYREYIEQQHMAKTKESGNTYVNYNSMQNLRIGRRFAVAVVHAAREGKLLYRDAYRLTGLYGDTFEKYAQSLTGDAL